MQAHSSNSPFAASASSQHHKIHEVYTTIYSDVCRHETGRVLLCDDILWRAIGWWIVGGSGVKDGECGMFIWHQVYSSQKYEHFNLQMSVFFALATWCLQCKICVHRTTCVRSNSHIADALKLAERLSDIIFFLSIYMMGLIHFWSIECLFNIHSLL